MQSNSGNEKNILVYTRKREGSTSKATASHCNNANAETSCDKGKVNDPVNTLAPAIGEDGRDKGRNLVFCVICSYTYHLQCVNPPLESMPEGDWRCANCEDLQESIAPKKASSNCSICLKGKRKMDWSHDEVIRKKFSTSSPKDKIQEFSPYYLELILSSLLEIFGLDKIHQEQGPSNVASDAERLSTESSKDIEMKNKDIVVYKRRKDTSSRKEMKHPNETITLDSECVIPKADANMECEIGKDGVVPEGNWKCSNGWFNTDPPKPKDDPSMSNN